ncbi:mononuclear molybdenum enzyme YedY, partial [Campylobacter coli]|nr:mononuclear molybdenum enzyme YedY [Campylobacter coli]
MIVTPEKLYKQRRDFFKLGAGALIGSSLIVSKLSALNFINDT